MALLTVTQDEFKKVQQGVSCDLRKKFWFGLPNGLPSERVKALQKNGAYVIPRSTHSVIRRTHIMNWHAKTSKGSMMLAWMAIKLTLCTGRCFEIPRHHLCVTLMSLKGHSIVAQVFFWAHITGHEYHTRIESHGFGCKGVLRTRLDGRGRN
jgi:hypothetical protein